MLFFRSHCNQMIRSYLPLWNSECNTCSSVCRKVPWGIPWFLTSWMVEAYKRLNSHQQSPSTIKWWHYSDARAKGNLLSLLHRQFSVCVTSVRCLTLRRISSQPPDTVLVNHVGCCPYNISWAHSRKTDGLNISRKPNLAERPTSWSVVGELHTPNRDLVQPVVKDYSKGGRFDQCAVETLKLYRPPLYSGRSLMQ